MKKLFKALSVIMIVALAFTSMGFANLTKVEAKSAVKSVKVKKAKKKLTLKVGAKKTFKVKVKAKKGKTKFKVKSSNKKVVKVKKKGKKITLTALKVGKAKVTVKSKINKKKKYVIRVKVIAKNQTETTKPKTTTKPTQPTTKAAEPTTEAPTVEPTTEAPTEGPTVEPTTEAPTEGPTVEPTTETPTEGPTVEPTTEAPTEGPTVEPTTEAPTEAQMCKVYGQVTDENGSPIEDATVYLEDDEGGYEDYTNENGEYCMEVEPGEYSMYAEYDDRESETQTVNLQGDTEVNFVINSPEYSTVTITSTQIDSKYLGYWKDANDDEEYYGNKLTLENRYYELYTNGYAYIDGTLYSYHAEVEFDLTDDMEIEATVSEIQEVSIESQKLIVGNQSVSGITEEPKLFKFTPTLTNMYRFWSNCTGEQDPYIKVYDSNFTFIGEHDDVLYDDEEEEYDYNFDLTLQLTGGNTYYIWLKSWEGTIDSLSMTIKGLLT